MVEYRDHVVYTSEYRAFITNNASTIMEVSEKLVSWEGPKLTKVLYVYDLGKILMLSVQISAYLWEILIGFLCICFLFINILYLLRNFGKFVW